MEKLEWDNLPQPGEGKPDPVVNEIVSCFLIHFEPVSSFTEANYMPTTTDIFLKIKALYPSENIIPEQVYKAMKENGYNYDMMPGTNAFYWLMKRKVPAVL